MKSRELLIKKKRTNIYKVHKRYWERQMKAKQWNVINTKNYKKHFSEMKKTWNNTLKWQTTYLGKLTQENQNETYPGRATGP